MQVLAHFKMYKVLKRKELTPMAQGSYLRDDARDEVIKILHTRGLIKGRIDGQKWNAGSNLYKNVTF